MQAQALGGVFGRHANELHRLLSLLFTLILNFLPHDRKEEAVSTFSGDAPDIAHAF